MRTPRSRQPPCREPEASRFFPQFTVHVQGYNGRSPSWRPSDDILVIFGPLKVLIPNLSSWVEEGNHGFRVGVPTRRPVSFGQITGRACQSTIGQSIRTTLGNGDNVLYMKVITADLLRSVAVFTSTLSTLLGTGSQGRGG